MTPIFLYTVYKVRCKLNSEYYIGVHRTAAPNDAYFGSGLRIRRLIKKYGVHHFYKEVLYSFVKLEEAFSKEIELLLLCKDDPNCLNLADGGRGGALFTGKKHSKETKLKLAEISRQQVLSAESRQKISESNRRRIVSQETREKIAAKNRSNVRGQNQKISQALKKFHEKNREFNIGPCRNVPKSAEHRAKISETMKAKAVTDPVVWMKNPALEKCRQVPASQVEWYEKLGYVRGRLKKK